MKQGGPKFRNNKSPLLYINPVQFAVMLVVWNFAVFPDFLKAARIRLGYKSDQRFCQELLVKLFKKCVYGVIQISGSSALGRSIHYLIFCDRSSHRVFIGKVFMIQLFQTFLTPDNFCSP